MHRFALMAVAVALFHSGSARAQAVGGPEKQLAITRTHLANVAAELERAVARSKAAGDAHAAAGAAGREQLRGAFSARDAARDRYAESVAAARATETAVRALDAARATATTKEQKDGLDAAARALETRARARENEARTAYAAAVTESEQLSHKLDVSMHEALRHVTATHKVFNDLVERRDMLEAHKRKLELAIENKK